MMIGGSSEATDQCALQPDGTLKDASDIVWFNDKDDDTPIASASTVQTARNQQTQNTARMQEIIEAEQASSESDSHPWPHWRKYNKCRREVLSVPEDMPYASTMSLGSSSESDNTITEITRDEIADMLPSKTKPLKSRKSSKGKGKAKVSSNKPSAAKKPRHKIDDAPNGAPDGDLSPALPLRCLASSNGFEGSSSSWKKGVKRNPIYLFYEAVDFAADGSPGKPGDKHYRCHHGNKKVLTIMKAMNHNLNGLLGHL
ncbi:hypothetical protein F5148DRAFT_1293400 [Russula earlei]|uniref:Uncharacterized protein n=1 Tax=Russula earlei TaxID=71964 RepID=A0ACC0TUT1_9AGAM|nr:hypothetical protein F5148DRAFT_1293400 [Russula earlei]